MCLRVLLDGARTHERTGEIESGGRVAPFLVPDVKRLERFFYWTMVHEAHGLEILLKFLLAYEIKVRPIPNRSDVAERLTLDWRRFNAAQVELL